MRFIFVVSTALGFLFSFAALAKTTRDWQGNPAVAQLPDFHGTLYVVGDVHGEHKKLFNLLKAAGLVRGTPDDFRWSGGDAVLVQLGDMIDKGNHALPAIDLVRSLEEVSQRDGGRVIVVAGNHEMGFLADPYAKKSADFRNEIDQAGLSLMHDVYGPDSKYGAWFRSRPAAALINGIFLSHSGWADGLSVDEIAARYQRAVDQEEWDNPFTCGDHKANPTTPGFFNADAWWLHGAPFDAQLAKLGARQVIFGHDPGAFHAKGEIAGYFGNAQGRALIKADVGMVKGDSEGVIYRCRDWLPGGGCAGPAILDLGDRDHDGFHSLKIKDHAPDFEAPPTPRDEC